MLGLPDANPAKTYDEGLERARIVMARDGDDVLPAARTALFDAGKQTSLAVLLLHGYTNSPAQYATLAPLLHEHGVNVFVPRMPEHGDRNRLTDRIAGLTAESLLQTVGEALDVAAGLGERTAVLGISMGGTIAAYVAQHRPIALAVPVAPDFALLELPYPVSRLVAQVLSILPNFFLWWDPRERQHHRPVTAYPRFSTRALAQTLRIGDDAFESARREAPLAQRIVTVVNSHDPAVNNDVTAQVSLEWRGWRPKAVEYVELRGLPANHDIIDPKNPVARTDLVYPRLLQALLS